MTLKTWSFSKRKNSTAIPTGTSRDYTTCYLKENTSIENPVFIIGSGIDAGISYCQAFDNYYFIDDIVMLTKDQVELHCSIDVLATHKTAIGNYSAFIERSASAYDTMIYDSAISQTQEVVGESYTTTNLFDTSHIDEDGVYVIGVIGAYGSSSGGISMYVLTESELEDALDFMFSDGNFPDVLTDSVVKSFFNPFQYIVFLRWYPLTKTAFGAVDVGQIKFGWWHTNANTYSKIRIIRYVTRSEVNLPTPYYQDFRAYDSRFTQYYLSIPSVGTVYLDPSLLSGTIKLACELYIDIATGMTTANLYRATGTGALTDRSRIASYRGRLGASIPVGQVNGEAGSLISSAIQTGVGVATENPGAAIQGIAGVVGSYNPPPSMVGNYESRGNYLDSVYLFTSMRSYRSGGLMTTHYGRPLDQLRTINTLSGFVKCRAASIALNAPDTEIEAVNTYLNSGFYYE